VKTKSLSLQVHGPFQLLLLACPPTSLSTTDSIDQSAGQQEPAMQAPFPSSFSPHGQKGQACTRPSHREEAGRPGETVPREGGRGGQVGLPRQTDRGRDQGSKACASRKRETKKEKKKKKNRTKETTKERGGGPNHCATCFAYFVSCSVGSMNR